MNAEFSRYEIASGRVVDSVVLPDIAAWKNPYYDGVHALFRGALDPATHYMSEGAPVERPASQAACDRSQIDADGEDVATLSGLPVPCVVAISGPVSSTFDVTDGELQFSASVPGDYRITVDAFPVQRWETTIHAV